MNTASLDDRNTKIWNSHTPPQVHLETNFVSLINPNGSRWHVWSPIHSITPDCEMRTLDTARPRAKLVFPQSDFWNSFKEMAIEMMRQVYTTSKCFPQIVRPEKFEEFLQGATLPWDDANNSVIVSRNLGRDASPLPLYDVFGTEHTGTFEIEINDRVMIHTTILCWCMDSQTYGVSFQIGPYGLTCLTCKQASEPLLHEWRPSQVILEKSKFRHPCGERFLVQLPEGMVSRVRKTYFDIHMVGSEWQLFIASMVTLPSKDTDMNATTIKVHCKDNSKVKEGEPISCVVEPQISRGKIKWNAVTIYSI